jgi:DHA1 family bicyclomycin/chloramphenicol resistance-like MFS transporter
MEAGKSSGGVYRLAGRAPHIVALMLLSAFAQMGAILMMPALPEIADYFSKNIGATQLVVTSFLLGYALGQLIYGPLANLYGRKFSLYIGICIATLGTLFSILSSPVNSFSLLIVGRFLEAVGSSAGLATSFTIINDFYFEAQARRITAVLMFAFAIVPGMAIAIGGVLSQYASWRSCYYFLLLYGLLLLYPAYLLPETLVTKDLNAIHLKNIFRNYKDKFLNKKLIGFALISGFSSACIYVFGAEGPFIGIHMLHVKPALYGFLAFTPYIGTILGSIIVVRYSQIEPIFLIKTAFSIEVIASCIMFIFFILHFITLYTLLIPMAIFCIGNPIIGATAASMSMQQSHDKANSSAVMNFSSIFMCVIMTFILGVLHNGSGVILPVIFLMALFLMAFTYVWIAKK